MKTSDRTLNRTLKCPLCNSELEEVNLLSSDGSPAKDGWECKSCGHTFDSALKFMLDKKE